MTRVTREDVIKAVGRADDVTIAEIIGTGATVDELAEAQAWIVNDEPLLNVGKPLASSRVRELIDSPPGRIPKSLIWNLEKECRRNRICRKTGMRRGIPCKLDS